MCKDFRKIKKNKFALLLLIINFSSSLTLYIYRKAPETTAIITLIENVLLFILSVLDLFKVRCPCKKKEEQTIENATSLLEALFESQNFVEQLKELKAKKYKNAEKLVDDIKREAEKLFNKL